MTEITLKTKLDEPGMNTSATTHNLKEELTRFGCRLAGRRRKEKEKPLSTALSKPPKPENSRTRHGHGQGPPAQCSVQRRLIGASITDQSGAQKFPNQVGLNQDQGG